jgi:hypothetical protein
MKKGFKIFLKAFAMICLITVVLCGCTQMGTPRAPGDNAARLTPNGTRAQGMGRDDLAGNTTGMRQGNLLGTNNRTGQNIYQGPNNGYDGLFPQQTSFDTRKANMIRNKLDKMNGLTEANVLVLGDTCIVGYKSNSATGDTTALKDRITRAVKQADSTITNVLVSESSDIVERIKRLGTGNANGINNTNGLNRNNNGLTGNTNGMNRNNNRTTGNTVGNTIIDEFNDLVRSMTPARR